MNNKLKRIPGPQCFLMAVLMAMGLVMTQATSFAEVPTTHGMLLFGTENKYVSHLPMFHPPHDQQLIIQVSLAGIGDPVGAQAPALKSYEQALAQGHLLFTIEPEVFRLSDLTQGSRSKFTANLYLGHFERGGKNLGKIEVAVQKIIYSSKLNAKTPLNPVMQHLIFGEKGEYYSAHLIGGAPSFDQISKVSQAYSFSFNPCDIRVCDEPVKLGVNDDELPMVIDSRQTEITSEQQLQVGDRIGFHWGIMSEVLATIYFEKDELVGH